LSSPSHTNSEPSPAHPADDSQPTTGKRPRDDRRRAPERREKPTSFIDSLSGMARRRHGRRDGESTNSYVDVYRHSDVGLILAIFILNVFDAVFTLAWLQRGGAEANPFMDHLLNEGDSVFLIQKCFVVGVWLLVLVVHKNFRIARVGMWMLLGLYGVIFVYHFYLGLSGVSPITGAQ
jgi:hypothetical protein